MKVRDIIESKGGDVVTVHQKTTVYKAMEKLASDKVGSLLVLDEKGAYVGILSTKDCLNAALKACNQLDQLTVKEVMTKEIIVCSLDDNLEKIENIITKNRVRHLPVIDKKKLVGIISIGDVVKAKMQEADVENQYLREYITGPFVE